MKIYLKKFTQFIEAVPSIVFIALLALFVNGGFKTHPQWFFIHSSMFVVLVSVLVGSLIQIKTKNLLFLFTLIFSIVLNEASFFHHSAQWLFFNLSLFDALTVKDENVASMIVICLLVSILAIIELYRYFFKKINLINIFILICSGAIIFTTVIFHYYIIHQNLQREKQIIFSNLNDLSKINPPLLGVLCKAQGYQCYTNPNFTDFTLQSKEFLDIYNQFNQLEVAQANFTTENNMIVLTKRQNKWIMDTFQYKNAFKNAEKMFLSLCVWAHGFWLLFMTFLITFHKRKKKHLSQ